MKISDKFHLEDIYKLKNTVLTGKNEDMMDPPFYIFSFTSENCIF